jgi:hypothetical protein
MSQERKNGDYKKTEKKKKQKRRKERMRGWTKARGGD